MSRDEINLATLFRPDQDFCKKLSTAAAQGMADAESGLTRVIAKLRWHAIGDAIQAKASELLDKDILELITDAWQKYNVLSDLAAETLSGSETALFPMGEHTIHSELHPYLEIQAGGGSYKLVLDVNADIELKGLMLKIEKGKIMSISSGSCEGSGEIKWKSLSLLKRKFKPIQLPGHMHLGAGIPLA